MMHAPLKQRCGISNALLNREELEEDDLDRIRKHCFSAGPSRLRHA
jgi:hypothetical protein